MVALKRGEIWIVDFDPTAGREQNGRRPAVVMSSDFLDTNLVGLAYVIPGTTSERVDKHGRPIPNHLGVQPTKSNGLRQVTFFMGEQLRSVSIERFVNKLGELTDKDLFELEEILILLLDLGPK